MTRQGRYPQELRERAVRMVFEVQLLPRPPTPFEQRLCGLLI
jgi:hypothetical protein